MQPKTREAGLGLTIFKRDYIRTMKLTLITISSSRGLVSVFVKLFVDPDGRVRIPLDLFQAMQQRVGVTERGQTFTVG